MTTNLNADAELYPRPIPAMAIFFNRAAETALYAAPAIDPVSELRAKLNELRTPYEIKSSIERPIEIEQAYKNERGDTIFGFNTAFGEWFILPKDSTTAYNLNEGGSTRSGGHGTPIKLKQGFRHELDREDLGELKADEVAGQFAIAASFEKKGGFDVQDVKLLTSYTAEERATLLKSILNHQISFVGIPEVRNIEKALQFANGDYLIISDDSANYSYKTLRMFTGPALNNLREIPVTDVARYMDGGTTFYETKEGVLFTPPAAEKDGIPKWQPASQASTPPDRDIDSWNSKYFPAQPLTKLDRAEMAQQINDPRIIGTKTWDQVKNAPKGHNL